MATLDPDPATAAPVDAVLVVSFGGPEGPGDVLPFLENVTRGRGVPPDRLAEVAAHYLDHFGGVSPLNAQCRELSAALQERLDYPVFWGNRNWHPLLSETLGEMAAAGVRHAYALTTSAFPSYSGCRQYREDIASVLAQVGPAAPDVTKLRNYHAEDGFLTPLGRNVADAMAGLSAPRLVFTAHSIPAAMAAASGPNGSAYVDALRAAAASVVERLDATPVWELAFQSRSGPPQIPWIEPDIGDCLARLRGEGVGEVVVVPLGFTSDHVEVLYDLDVVAARQAAELGMTMRRAATVGTAPEFADMLARLVHERRDGPERADHGGIATHDRCPVHCCAAR